MIVGHDGQRAAALSRGARGPPDSLLIAIQLVSETGCRPESGIRWWEAERQRWCRMSGL